MNGGKGTPALDSVRTGGDDGPEEVVDDAPAVIAGDGGAARRVLDRLEGNLEMTALWRKGAMS
jgi:hypothetical protein